jgi:hypothetical protein
MMAWSMTFLVKRFLKIGLCVRGKTPRDLGIVRIMMIRMIRLKMTQMMTGEDGEDLSQELLEVG